MRCSKLCSRTRSVENSNLFKDKELIFNKHLLNTYYFCMKPFTAAGTGHSFDLVRVAKIRKNTKNTYFLYKKNSHWNMKYCFSWQACFVQVLKNSFTCQMSSILRVHQTKAARSRSIRTPKRCHSRWWIHSSCVVSKHASTAPPFHAMTRGSMSCVQQPSVRTYRSMNSG